MMSMETVALLALMTSSDALLPLEAIAGII